MRYQSNMLRKSITPWVFILTVGLCWAATENVPPGIMSAKLLGSILDQLSGRSLLDGLTRKLTNLTDRPIDVSRLVQGLLPKMRQPTRLLGLPALEPFQMQQLPLDMDTDMARMKGEAWNVTVTGISGMRARQLTLRPLSSRVDFQLLFPELKATGNYRVNGSFAKTLYAFGEGPFNVTVNDLNATGFLVLNPTREQLKVKDIYVELSMSRLQTDLQGLLGGGDTSRLLNEALSDAAPRLLREQRQEASRYASDLLRGALDRQLTSVHGAGWARAYRYVVCAATVGLVCRPPT